MCFNCGCQNPQDDMGNSNNITEQTLMHLSGHWGKPLEETKKILFGLLKNSDNKLEEDEHLKEMFEKASKAWGQSIDEAKKNTYELLKQQVGKDQ